MSKFLDYDGLKTVVASMRKEIPVADGVTIIQNADGTLSAKTNYIPTVDTSTGTLVFDFSPTYVDESTETLVYVTK